MQFLAKCYRMSRWSKCRDRACMASRLCVLPPRMTTRILSCCRSFRLAVAVVWRLVAFVLSSLASFAAWEFWIGFPARWMMLFRCQIKMIARKFKNLFAFIVKFKALNNYPCAHFEQFFYFNAAVSEFIEDECEKLWIDEIDIMLSWRNHNAVRILFRMNIEKHWILKQYLRKSFYKKINFLIKKSYLINLLLFKSEIRIWIKAFFGDIARRFAETFIENSSHLRSIWSGCVRCWRKKSRIDNAQWLGTFELAAGWSLQIGG